MNYIEIAKQVIKSIYIKRLLMQYRRQRKHLCAQFEGLDPELWGCGVNRSGHLTVQNMDTVKLVNEYGSPLHVIDKVRLIQNYQDFIGCFRRYLPRVELATSYKTNPLPGVLSMLHEAGTWAEVISHFELWLALELGVPPNHIVLNGPGKGRQCIEFAVSSGVNLINIDGFEEIAWLSDIAQAKGRRQNVGLRLVTSVGWKGQFGTRIDTGESMDTFREIKQHPELNPCALHLHLGTGIKDVSAYLQAIREVLEFSSHLRKELGIQIEIYDFGGGFGVPTVRTPDAWDLRMADFGHGPRLPMPEDCPPTDTYARGIAELVKQMHPRFSENPPLVILEPGRAITSSSQLLLLSVLVVKRPRELQPRIILDGGKNITIPLGYEVHQIFPASRMHMDASERFDLYGPLCHPGDVIARCKDLPTLHTGDVVAIMDAGAYFIPNQMNFSLPRPAAVLVDGRSVETIRTRESFRDIVKLDSIFYGGCKGND